MCYNPGLHGDLCSSFYPGSSGLLLLCMESSPPRSFIFGVFPAPSVELICTPIPVSVLLCTYSTDIASWFLFHVFTQELR